MKFLNKTGVALRLIAVWPIIMMVGCVTSETWDDFEAGGTYLNRLPPCDYAGDVIYDAKYFNCEMERTTYAIGLGGSQETRVKEYFEYGPNGTLNGLKIAKWFKTWGGADVSTECLEDHKRKAYFDENPGKYNYNTASSHQEVRRICEPIRAANNTHTTPALTTNQETSPAKSAEQRLAACDSFGFERGTEAHAECAMKLYMNEQNQGTANAITSSNNQQTAALARQQAIQEATIKEQERIRQLEAALRGVQAGIEIMTGTSTTRRSSQTHSQTYNINGQIIRCTTTGSITTCL